MASSHQDAELEGSSSTSQFSAFDCPKFSTQSGVKKKRCRKSYQVSDDSRSECEIRYNIAEYRNDAFEVMNIMKNDKVLTDVKLEVGTETIYAHKIVLSSASPYFKAMFTGGLKEAEMDTVKLHSVCPRILSRLLTFMYTGEITINQMIVCQLLSAATMFQMTHVINTCVSFLESQLEPSNAIGIANFGMHNGCMDLYRKVNAYIEQHFTEVSQEDEFIQLSPCELVSLIRRDELNVHDEKLVYNAVLRWVLHDEEKRRPKMERILQVVRCQYLSPGFINDQMTHCRLLKKIPACRAYLAKIFEDLTLHKPPQQKERKPNAPCHIYLIGGYRNRQSLDTVECYDIDECYWSKLASLPQSRSGLGAAYLHGFLYAIGGRNVLPNGNFTDSKLVETYDPIKNSWSRVSSMNCPRNRLGVTVLDGQVYAIGGSNGTQCHKSVEKFDPENKCWAFVHSTHEARMGVGVVVVNRLLYAIGGFNGETRLNSVECYLPELDKWNFKASMKVSRSGAGVCAVGTTIYVIGGYDGTDQLSSVEKYDTLTDEWSFLPSLKIARSAMTVSVWDNKVFVIGGYGGNTFLSSVEIFDIQQNEWTEAKNLLCGRSGHAAASSIHPCYITYDDR